MAFRLFYLMSQNDTWLAESAWPVVASSAQFFASRFVHEDSTGNYTLLNVQPADERAGIVSSPITRHILLSSSIRSFLCFFFLPSDSAFFLLLPIFFPLTR
jgi:hypothetical protein